MKRIFLLAVVISSFLVTENLFAQAYQNSWEFGFGLTYPRFFSTDVRPLEGNVGGYLSIQRNFSENVALRLSANYDHIQGRVPGFNPITNNYYYTNGTTVPSLAEKMHTNLASGNLDLLYYLAPCSPVNPFIGGGVGLVYFKPDWPSNVINSQIVSKTTAQFNLIVGSEWKVGEDWKLNTEFIFNSTDGEMDGIVNNNRQGVFGSDGDGYIMANVGLVYYFAKGDKSKYCDLYTGITVQMPNENYPTLSQIDSLIIAHIPKQIEKEVIVEKPAPIEKPVENNIILYGINFEFDKSKLLPEAYPILGHAKEILTQNPNIKVEVQGYCDGIGSDAYNQKLSERRANTVRDYLIKQGIENNRITAVGYGKSNPVADNNTELGRAENRRIEFKILK
jgi:OOP family OmpA-OmpF porin